MKEYYTEGLASHCGLRNARVTGTATFPIPDNILRFGLETLNNQKPPFTE